MQKRMNDLDTLWNQSHYIDTMFFICARNINKTERNVTPLEFPVHIGRVPFAKVPPCSLVRELVRRRLGASEGPREHLDGHTQTSCGQTTTHLWGVGIHGSLVAQILPPLIRVFLHTQIQACDLYQFSTLVISPSDRFCVQISVSGLCAARYVLPSIFSISHESRALHKLP